MARSSSLLSNSYVGCASSAPQRAWCVADAPIAPLPIMIPQLECSTHNAREGKMAKPLLQTTIAGSLPKPSWLAQPNQLWAPWLMEGEALEEAKRDATRLAVRDQ